MIPEGFARGRLAECCRMLYERGLTRSAGGNMSVRTDAGILITPSGVNKGRLAPEDMVLVSPDGTVLKGGRPSIETGFHLAVYEEAPDTGAVLHCHPLYCIAATLGGMRIGCDLTPEGVILLGDVPSVEYIPPGTPELVEAVRAHAGSNAIILEKHGAITRGKDLDEAFDRMEELEFQARLRFILGDREVSPAGREGLL